MPNYLLVYHGGSMPETEEEGEEEMRAWTAWFGSLGDAVVDGGNPVGMSKTVHPGGKVTDDGGKDPTSGYTVIAAATIDDAVAMAKGSPHLRHGTIEVAQIIEMG